MSDVKLGISRHISSCHGVDLSSIGPGKEFTLILSEGMMAFVVPEMLSLCQPQRLQGGKEIFPEFIFPRAPLPPQNSGLEAKIRDCQNRVRYSCPYCDKSYGAAIDLAGHLEWHTKPFYICPIVHCRQHVGEFQMTNKQMRTHHGIHRGKGELKFPRSAMPLPKYYWIREPHDVESHLSSLAKRESSAANPVETVIEEESPTSAETGQWTNSVDEWYSTLKRQAGELDHPDAVQRGTISEETRAQVLAYNIQKQRDGRL